VVAVALKQNTTIGAEKPQLEEWIARGW